MFPLALAYQFSETAPPLRFVVWTAYVTIGETKCGARDLLARGLSSISVCFRCMIMLPDELTFRCASSKT